MPRRWIWNAAALALCAGVSFELGTRATPPPPAARLESDLVALRAALSRYHDEHGFYPCDPERDYNRDGRADLLRLQLTGFTRDDGKPSERRDAEYRFGPCMAEIPALAGSRQFVVDQARSRTLVRLAADVRADIGTGGWYYEARTGFVVPNQGRGRAPRLAGVR
jgi:hypothetical protein